jgi:hypothetical protein
MTDRRTISISEATFEEAKANKDGRTWDELVLDGAHTDETASADDEGQDERQAQPLTADDVPMLRREVADEVESRLTRR